MAKIVTFTNTSDGPKGIPEVGKPEATMVQVGETVDGLIVADSILVILENMRDAGEADVDVTGEKDEPKTQRAEGVSAPVPTPAPAQPKTYTVGPFVEAALAKGGLTNLSDLQAALNAIEAFAASLSQNADETPPEPVKTDNTNLSDDAGDYEPSLDFENLDDDTLRAFLKAAPTQPHHRAGHDKLVEAALKEDRRQWDEARKPSDDQEAV